MLYTEVTSLVAKRQVNMYRVCCKTWKLLCTFCINLVPRVLSERELGNEVGCKTVLRWVVKRATSLFNSFCSNVAKQVATSFILYFLEYIPRQKGQHKEKQKKGTKNKERQEKEKYHQLSCCLPWRRLALHLIRYNRHSPLLKREWKISQRLLEL